MQLRGAVTAAAEAWDSVALSTFTESNSRCQDLVSEFFITSDGKLVPVTESLAGPPFSQPPTTANLLAVRGFASSR